MKTNTTWLRKLTLLASFCAATFLVSSCSDDDVDTGKSVNVKVVNASEGAGDQDFFVEGSKVMTVAENQSSGYVAVTQSGNDRDVQFKKAGANEVYASDDFDLRDNRNYTFFLTGTGSSVDIKATEDDLTAPASGKVKVRIIHLSSVVPQPVDVYTLPNTKVASAVKYGDLSNFITIDPSVGVGVLPEGSTDVSKIMDLSLGALQAGKIYTVVVSGSTTVRAWTVMHN